MKIAARVLVWAFLAVSAMAQRPVFVPDDFVDPSIHSGAVFLSRLVAGASWNRTDHSRPIQGDPGFVLLSNAFYIQRWQFTYNHTEPSPDDAQAVQRCDCPDPVYFPTPPPADATPAGPRAGRGDTVQLSFYETRHDSSRAPITLRYRLSLTRQELRTVVTSIPTGSVIESRSGHDRSLTLDADTHFGFRGRDVWGTLYFAQASRSGTPHEDRTQNELAYVWRPPGGAIGEVLYRPELAVGVISGRGATGLNLVNPSLELFWRHRDTKINVHLVWSPQATRDGGGWHLRHEIALFADRTIWLKIFGQ